MKKLVLLISALIVNLAFADQNLDWIAAEYNSNIQTSENLIYYAGQSNKAGAEALKKYFKENNISITDQLPRLVAYQNYLAFAGDKKAELKLIPSKDGGYEITYKKKKAHFKSSLTIDEAKALLNNLSSSNGKTSFSNFFISDAYAEGILDAAGIAWSGISATVQLSALYGAAFVADKFKGLAELPKSRSDQNVRKQVEEACDNITAGKKVADVTKLRLKLEKLKSEDECVPFWEANMYHSCKWYENNLNCLAQGSIEISDDKRESKKSGTTETPAEAKSASGKSK